MVEENSERLVSPDSEKQASEVVRSGFQRFASALMLSRVLGAARDVAMARAFGDSSHAALFFIALRFALLLRRFFGEGPLGSAFIPRYLAEKKQSLQKANLFFAEIALKLTITTLAITLIMAFAIHIFTVFVPINYQTLYVLSLLKKMLPVLTLVALYGLTVALQQCHQRFFFSQVAPALTNVMWLIGIAATMHLPQEKALSALSQFIVLGFLFTLLLSFLTMPRSALNAFKVLNIRMVCSFSPKVRALLRSFFLGIIGIGAMQISVFLDSIFALKASSQGPVFLWYSQRFYQLAFACFSLGFTASVIPLVTKYIKKEHHLQAQQSFTLGASRVMTATLIASFALIFMGYGFIDMFFGSKSFSQLGVYHTTLCLGFYAIGLAPASLVALFASTFYAHDDFKTPLKCSLVAIFLHLVLNMITIFILDMGPHYIALNTSLSTLINCLLLMRYCDKKLCVLDLSPLLSTLLITVLASTAGAFVLYRGYSQGFSKYFSTGSAIFSFIAVLFILAQVARSQEIKALFSLVKLKRD